jgi:hypothetical protein
VQRIVEHDERGHGHEQATEQAQTSEAPRSRVARAGPGTVTVTVTVTGVSSGLDLPQIHADNVATKETLMLPRPISLTLVYD